MQYEHSKFQKSFFAYSKRHPLRAIKHIFNAIQDFIWNISSHFATLVAIGDWFSASLEQVI